MKEAVLYIAIFFALGFGFKAQGQNYEVKSLHDKLNMLPSTEKSNVEYLLFGTPALLILNEEATYVWNKGKDIETIDVELTNKKLLTDVSYAKDFKKAIALILRYNKGDVYEISESHFQYFKSLKYILIKHDKSISEQEIKEVIDNLVLQNDLKEVIFLLESNSGIDEEF